VTSAALMAGVLALSASASVSAVESSYQLGKTDLLSRMDAYASAAGLMPLPSSASNELRIWARNYMFGDLTGYVVTEKSISICMARVELHEKTITVLPAKCHQVEKWRGQKSVFGKIEDLSRFDQRQVDCGVMDGIGYSIDGTVNERRFAFSADNPQSCNDEVSRAVVEVLRQLPRED
jgi:hypothetical protein